MFNTDGVVRDCESRITEYRSRVHVDVILHQTYKMVPLVRWTVQ